MEKYRYIFLSKENNFEMLSDWRDPYQRPSTHIMDNTTIGYFTETLSSDRYMGQERGRMHHHHLEGDQHWVRAHPQPHPWPPAQSHDPITRELEKERIRQEIIMSEILRRRELEAEVRREMMLESELALQVGNNVFPFGSPPLMGLDLPMRLPQVETRPDGRSLEGRITLSLTRPNSLSNRLQSRLSEPLPSQSASDEGVKEKKKINLQAKAIENITGAKRALSGLEAGESQHNNLKKKAIVELSCDLCQVRATSQQTLNDHLKGKKHKTKEAAVRTQNALTIKTAAKSITDSGDKIEVKVKPVLLPFSKSGGGTSESDLPLLQEHLNSGNLKKNEEVVPHKVKKNGKHGKEKRKYWCKICQIGVYSQEVMDRHQMGKKHRLQLEKRNKCGRVKDESVKEETSEQDRVAVVEPVIIC